MKLTHTRRYMLVKNAVKGLVPRRFPRRDPIDDSASIADAPPVIMEWPAEVPKPRVGLVPDADIYPYWTKYRRFLKANDIDFSLYDVHRSTWLQEAADFDMIVWRPMSYPYELDECRRKIFVLERLLGKLCYPSLDEVLVYEDKLLQYELLTSHGLPVVETFVSHSEEEARRHMARREYPAVWKLATGSASLGVELLPHANAGERWARGVFSFGGRRTYWPYVAQKNYVYVQRLEPNQGFDVRVLVVGDKVFGYYRDVPKGEFRASGMGLVRKEMLPPAAIEVARRAATVFDAPCLAVDCIIDPSGERALILEVSSFIQMETPEQLLVDGEPGMLVGEQLEFVCCKVWLQELALERVLRTKWIGRFDA